MNSLFKSGSILAAMTMLSRIFGFMRDMYTAKIFGAGMAFDAFSLAFRIPNFMRRLFAEGAFTQAFVPALAAQAGDRQQLHEFIDIAFGNLCIVLLVVTLLGMILAPQIIGVFAPGFKGDAERFKYAITMLRITFPYLLCVSLTAFAVAILNVHNKFWLGPLAPIVLNIAMIMAAAYLAPCLTVPITSLAWGVLLAGISQLGLSCCFLASVGVVIKPKINWQHQGVRLILKLMAPAIFGVSVSQINLLVDCIFASLLPAGALSWLYYSDRLMEFPLGVFSVTIATVILPALSRYVQRDDRVKFSQVMDWALMMILLLGVPATVAVMVVPVPLLATLFQYGNFSANAVIMSSKSLMMFGVGMVPLMTIKVIVASFYAQKNTMTPVVIGVLAMLSNLLFNFILLRYCGHAGIALATSLAAVINSVSLWYMLSRQNIYLSQLRWVAFLLKLMLATLSMMGYLWFIQGPELAWLGHGLQWRVGHLALLLLPAALIYIIVLQLSGFDFNTLLVRPES